MRDLGAGPLQAFAEFVIPGLQTGDLGLRASIGRKSAITREPASGVISSGTG